MSPYDVLVLVHGLAGTTGVGLFVVQLVIAKGGRWHRRLGLGFTVAMAVVTLSGLVLPLSWLVSLSSFESADPTLAVLLIGLATMIGAAIWRGWRAATRRGLRTAADRVMAGVVVVVAVAVLTGSVRLDSALLGGLGVLMMLAVVRDQSRLRPKSHVDEHWAANLVAVVGGVTGFLVLRGALWLVLPILGVLVMATWAARRRHLQNQRDAES